MEEDLVGEVIVTVRRTVTLYRPVGGQELDLIRRSGFRTFPPRLPEQPFFYPVLNQNYAAQIARDWNSIDPGSGSVGHVTEFEVDADYLAEFQIHTVGSSVHREYWIPAEELGEFNDQIVGRIRVIRSF